VIMMSLVVPMVMLVMLVVPMVMLVMLLVHMVLLVMLVMIQHQGRGVPSKKMHAKLVKGRVQQGGGGKGWC
jgi:hypothetical protein